MFGVALIILFWLCVIAFAIHIKMEQYKYEKAKQLARAKRKARKEKIKSSVVFVDNTTGEVIG